MAERVEEVRTLTALLEHEHPTWDQILDWSEEIAGELTALHAKGEAHGDVTADGIWMQEGRARLSPPADLRPETNDIHDIVQFSALLRRLIGAAEASRSDEKLKTALEQIAETSARAATGSKMRKVASALHVIHAARRFEVASVKPAEAPPASIPHESRSGHRVLLLAREVPPAGEVRRRVRPSAMHLLGLTVLGLLSIGGIAVAVMKLWH